MDRSIEPADGRSRAVRLVTADEIADARARLHGIALRTPLVASPELSAITGAEIRLKCESLQCGGSFKIRGAFNYLSQLEDSQRKRGVVTYSSGNHAQGVALAARLLGSHAIAVMPLSAPAIKQEGARRLGADVVLEGYTSVERRTRAEAIAAETGRTVVPGFDDRRIVAGQGTIGLEIVEDWPEVDTVLVPCGGGGLLAGIAVAIKSLSPNARVIGVEPVAAPSMTAALAAGAPVLLERTRTIADGLAAVRVSDLTLAHVRALVHEIVTVEEEALRAATAWHFLHDKLVIEFSGAAGVAALQTDRVQMRGRRIAVVISGGNIDPSAMTELFSATQPATS
ncbi:MAG: Threonine dehydratase, catabolic [Gemmatimonadetes bacterium]|nr:Threonine dehydratase, catabolic [Gemmatimonadota bacterium]